MSPLHADWDALLQRVRGEYFEMPGLRLTTAQAARLWTLDAPTCEALMTDLVEAGFLFRTGDGAFIRAGGAPRCPLVPATIDALRRPDHAA